MTKERRSILIAWHSRGGGTESLANAVLRGARRETAVEARLVRAFDVTVEDMLASDAFVFGTPENFGYMSGALKDLFDRVYYPTEGRLVNRPYAAFVKAGNDGTGAVRAIERIVTGMQLRKIAEAIVVAGDVRDAHLEQCEEMGQGLAVGLEMGIY